jgi:D-inositol-3-phosphate glycosyltransferase
MLTTKQRKGIIMKKKILCYCDSPTCATGFGSVSRNVLEQLYKTGNYDIDIFGINYHGTPHSLPYKIWPAMDHQTGDPYGRRKFCYFALEHDFDILWVLQDTFIVDFLPELISHLKSNRTKPFRTIMYYPIDSILKETWYNNINIVDRLIAYTDFGKQAFINQNIKHEQGGILRDVDVIYHGVDTNTFKVLSDIDVASFRKNYFSYNSSKFIFMNINRNQQRKDIPRTIHAFKLFNQQVPNSLLYLHMCPVDQGWNIPELLKEYDLTLGKEVVLPEKMEPNQGYPINIINYLYNSSDCVISTTLGEGFGISWLEAMACKIPTIMPNNTAMKELITEDKGYLVDCGSNASLWTVVPNDNDLQRPLVDVDDLVVKMLHVYNNYVEAKNKAEVAYKWVYQNMRWSDNIARQWGKVFKEECSKLETFNPKNTIKVEQL